MTELVSRLRESRKSPVVLKLKLIAVRSVRPEILVFVFEGIDDVGVFESWISRTTTRPCYEPVAGSGKEQVLGLRNLLRDDDLIRGVYFFVDCDFDCYQNADEHVFVLNAYSVENSVCSTEVLDSLLCDEFRCAGEPIERRRIKEKYSELAEAFRGFSQDVNFLLFVARRLGIVVTRKPEKVNEVADVQLLAIVPAFTNAADVVELAGEPDAESLRELKKEFDNLPPCRSQRGKYVMGMFVKWLQLLAEDRKAQRPVLFDRQISKLPGDPGCLQLRRLASQSPLPQGLDEFLASAVAPTLELFNTQSLMTNS